MEMLKKIDKADITQQLGNDTGKVVSQHLLTTEVGKLQPKGDYAYKSDLSTKRDVTNTILKHFHTSHTTHNLTQFGSLLTKKMRIGARV